MITRRSFMITGMAALGALAGVSPITLVKAAPKARFVVIVAKNNSLQELSFRELKRLYMGENVVAPNGKKLVPLAHAIGSRERMAFDELVTGMDADTYARYWIDRKIRGQSAPPKSVESAELILKFVSKLENTVSYIRDADLKGDFKADVKIVRIDGKAPGEPGYRLEY